MLKLMKYLKKSLWAILLVIVLLVVQAMCDLSLPEYTSRIINVGIQQGGVEEMVPKVMRKSVMENILLFTDETERKEILSAYRLIDKKTVSESAYNDYLDDYSTLKKEPLYVLKDTADKESKTLLNALQKPMLVVSTLGGNTKQAQEMKAGMLAQFPPSLGVTEKTDIFSMIAMLPKEAIEPMKKELNTKMSAMSDMMLEQGAISFIKGEYRAVGMNLESLQNNYIILTGLKMLALALVSMVATIAVGYIGARVAAKLARDLRGNVFKKVVGFSNNEFKKFSTASLITRSTNDITQIQMVMVMLLRIVFYAPILGVGGVIKVLNTNTSMAWIIAVAVMAIMSIVLILFGIVMPKFKIVQKLIDKVNLVMREILVGLPVIRAFSNQKYEEKRFDDANKNLTRTSLFVNRVMSLMMPVMMFVMNVVMIAIVWKGARSIDAGSMQVGDMMAFIQYTMQIIMSFLMISMVSIMLPRASVSASRIEEVLSTKLTMKDPKEPKAFLPSKKGVIEFKHVSFRYPDAELDVIRDVSFVAQPGQTTAFIGSTGSGKSTLVNLIPRFFDVTKGHIYVDGVDIRDVNGHDLRSKIGYVPQKGVLFSGTIETNLKYGDAAITDDVMKKSAAIAQATDFIESTSNGFDSEISQGGSNVSGGQKQRLSIARAIAIQPQIYIFDDSFSALDFKTDATLRAALKSETKESTVLIVAQRISTIMHAEQIVVMDDGKVVGIGTHRELLENCSVYKQIAESQLTKEELANE